MNLLVLSDLHMSAQTPERNSLFLQVLENAHKNQDRVLLLGDLFDLWFGEPALTMPFQKPILEKMKQLAGEGLHMDYVEGNRDFFLQTLAGSMFRSVNSHGFSCNWGPYHLYAEHGDWINVDDLPYRTFRRLTKNRVARAIVHSLPSAFLLRRAEGMERRMRTTNLKYKTHYPETHCRRFVEQKAAAGADLVLIGHFHDEKSWEIQASAKTVLFYNLPGWETGFRYLVIPSDPLQRPYFKAEGKQPNGHPAAT